MISLNNRHTFLCILQKEHLVDYLDSDIYLSDKTKIDEHLKLLSEETIAYIQEMHEEKKLPLKFYVYEDFKRLLYNQYVIEGKPLLILLRELRRLIYLMVIWNIYYL